MDKLAIKKRRCTGCRLCESACAMSHEALAALLNARIQIFNAASGLTDYDIKVCRQCKECPPIAACPQGAISRDDGTGAILIDISRCPPGCAICVGACPLNSIFRGTGKVVVCDLCGGDPICAKYCATEAIYLTSVKSSSVA